jgi:hypothetical protein
MNMITQLYWDFEYSSTRSERCLEGILEWGEKCFECQSKYGNDIASVCSQRSESSYIHMRVRRKFEWHLCQRSFTNMNSEIVSLKDRTLISNKLARLWAC